MSEIKLTKLDCTLRDGGYYNSWDFSVPLINQYLESMSSSNIDVVELGFRSLKNDGFKGACAYTTDDFINVLNVPESLTLGVMINGSELVEGTISENLMHLFPVPANESPISLVRIACHAHEFEPALEAVSWLKKNGYFVGFNLMQIASRSESVIRDLARQASKHDIDVLYFADSMGSMTPNDTAKIVNWLRCEWKGEIGIHTHDNLGLALTNTLRGLKEGVTWVDTTVTGMGRGPGNARTEELVIELAIQNAKVVNIVPLMNLVRKYFKPMQLQYGWGTNPYYYLAGKHQIHPTYIQEMLNDSRYNDEDLLAVINYLRENEGAEFSWDTLNMARHFYNGPPIGKWSPMSLLKGKDVLLLGTGPGVNKHRIALENFIRKNNVIVIALNTQDKISPELIDVRIACHPARLLADCEVHVKLPQPLITPFSMLPDDIRNALSDKEVFDYGLNVQLETFIFDKSSCTIPSSLVLAYSLAIMSSGQAKKVYLSGFDGYSGEDSRNDEANTLFKQFQMAEGSVEILAITPTRYDIPKSSIYGDLH